MEIAEIRARGGYLRIFRSIKDKYWFNDSQSVHLWLFLLLEASWDPHQKKEAFFGGKVIKLQPGQIITGREEIAKNLKISPSKVERILKKWTTLDKQIEQVITPRGRLISILNWDKYQIDEQLPDNQMNNYRTTGEHYLNNSNNKEKEILKEKEKSELHRQLPTSPPPPSDEKLSQTLNLSKQLLLSFDAARVFYPGSKRGLETELRYFLRCHKKESKKIIPFLEPAIRSQIEQRKEKKKRGVFVPEWKHFKTWVYNRWWESDI